MQILGESVNMNAYFSPANGVSSLGCHYDIQEHFIIQFSGKKTWRMYEGLEPNPTEKLFFDQGSEQRRPTDKAYQDITVEPGDVLYFSRGQWHEPIPTDEHSLHLTVTVPITFQFQAIQWVIKKLSANVELRKALPMILEDPASHEAFIKEVEVARLAALEIIQSPDFSRQAFFDKFQESFAITSDHRDDTE